MKAWKNVLGYIQEIGMKLIG
jgi:hypothetical protein